MFDESHEFDIDECIEDVGHPLPAWNSLTPEQRAAVNKRIDDARSQGRIRGEGPNTGTQPPATAGPNREPHKEDTMAVNKDLPFGWEIREVGCGHTFTFEIWFEGKFMDDRATRGEAEAFVTEMEACRPADVTQLQ